MNPKRFDMNLLGSLDVLIREANVSRAAEVLNLSQPAVSAQLKRLREMFDDPLLVPADTGRGMVPTPLALELAAPLRAGLQGLQAVLKRRPAFDPSRTARHFRIGANDFVTLVLGPHLLQQAMRHGNPNLRFAFVQPDARLVADDLERGTLDLLIGSDRMVPPTARVRKLFDERFVMVQRCGHPRGRVVPDLDTYCALHHALTSTSGGSFYGFVDEHLERLGRRREVVLSVDKVLLLPSLLSASDLVSTVPSRLASRFAGTLDAVELPLEVGTFGVFAAWHPRVHADPGLIWLRSLLGLDEERT